MTDIAGLTWALDQSIPVDVIKDLLHKMDPSLEEVFQDVMLAAIRSQ